MPREDDHVHVRTSASAQDIWSRFHAASPDNGFRIRTPLLPSNRDTPYGRQQAPFPTNHNVQTPSLNENRPSPIVVAVEAPVVCSRDIERLVFRTALAEIDTNENARLKRELRRVEGELQRALCLNRALTGEMVRNARDRAAMP